MRRTLIVGLDGADPSLVFGRGDLPHLSRLMARSDAGHGPLTSTLPPMTLPAWASFLTGVPPAHHGIFDFAQADPVRRRVRFLDARDRAVPTLAGRLSAAGRKVTLLFFPSTWPPEALSGGCVAGFDSPVATRIPASAYSPRALHRRAREWVGRDLSYADFSELRKGPAWEADAAGALLRGIEEKERFALELIRRDGPHDLFGILFGEADTASHHFWHLHDPTSPRHCAAMASAHGDVLRTVYRRLDAAVGALCSAGAFERVIIASDHGFGGTSDRGVRINAFLRDAGLLSLHPAGGRLGRVRARIAAGLPPRWTEAVARGLPRAVLERLEWRARYGAIDFDRTLAWSEELNYAPSVRLSTDGTGCEDRVVEALRSWRDPVDGGPVVSAVHRRREVHVGPLGRRAPDLILELRAPGGWSYVVLPTRPGDPVHERLTERRGGKGRGMPGSHRRDGVWIAVGAGLASGRRSVDALLPAALGDAPTASAVAAPPSDGHPSALRARLRSLGYLA